MIASVKCIIIISNVICYTILCMLKWMRNTTRKTSSCGGPIAAATGRLLRCVLGLPLYMKSIAAGQ